MILNTILGSLLVKMIIFNFNKVLKKLFLFKEKMEKWFMISMNCWKIIFLK